MSALAWQSPLLGGILSTSMVWTQLSPGLQREHVTSELQSWGAFFGFSQTSVWAYRRVSRGIP
jgi:hypothetical protein